MTAKTTAVMEIAHAVSQLRAIAFIARDSHPESVAWLEPEVRHAEEHLQNAVEALDVDPQPVEPSGSGAVSEGSLLARLTEFVRIHSQAPNLIMDACPIGADLSFVAEPRHLTFGDLRRLAGGGNTPTGAAF